MGSFFMDVNSFSLNDGYCENNYSTLETIIKFSFYF
ncbi:hypothetical protein CLV51_103614 [Chitinophaga niastensis]|uniref:Uncharacterized protein n=1 Tax=Chitinophaga niastensis TaxID=536980 RepID=A0A2P8HK85_CHINA|nr:hypothetical protein CLV51_103614 [Chitinophaga niastensis]